MASNKDGEKEKAYVFHFQLEDQISSGKETDALTALVKFQLQSLLNVVVLTRNGEEVEVDGFRFRETGASHHRIFDESPDAGGA